MSMRLMRARSLSEGNPGKSLSARRSRNACSEAEPALEIRTSGPRALPSRDSDGEPRYGLSKRSSVPCR